MNWLGLLVAYFIIRTLFRYAFYEQGMSASHALKIMAEGFLVVICTIALLAIIGSNV